MAKCILFLSVFICFLSVFWVAEIEQLRPYQDIIKPPITEFVKTVIDTSLTFFQTYVYSQSRKTDKVFTKAELATFNGKDGGSIYITLLGSVFDVTRGRQHYGPDGGYHGFAGRDGTRAFVTGEFNDKGLVESVDGLSLDDIHGLEEWKQFYLKGYSYVGKLEGHFYDSKGQPTANMQSYQRQLQLANEKRKDKEAENKLFPPCNSESKQDSPLRLWCSNLSGGISRDWAGVPREFHQAGRTHNRCACVRTSGPPSSHTGSEPNNDRGDLDDPHFRVYPGCDPQAISCYIKMD